LVLTPKKKGVVGGNVKQIIQTHGREAEDDLEDLVVDGKIITTLTTWKQCKRTWNRLNLLNRSDQRGTSATTVTDFLACCDSVQQHNTTRDEHSTERQDVI
jgi:hypothetical protein